MKRLYYLAALGALVLLSLTILAAPPARAEEEPTPGVARVSLIHGDVSTMRGDSGDWVATSINAPLVRGDKITTGEKSRTEIQLDHSNILRLASHTEVRIADLTRTEIQLEVAQGLVNYTVFKTNEAEIEIDTPNMAVRPVKEGSYRIEVKSPTETELIVRKGDADVSTPKGTVRVEEGRVIMVRGSEDPVYQIAMAPHRDEWDKWNKERDADIREAKSYRYANRYYTGAHDLDRHGRWIYVPDYDDWCWIPYVGVGWAPYRYGYWGWAPYWGWTWISYEPWGWAPYHYGRWFWWNNSWCWWPGYRYYGYYPTWGPAWVSFLGFGFGGRNWHFGFGFGFNSIGWCPLGPYDPFYPWWGGYNSYNVVNITNVTNITNVDNQRRGDRWYPRGRGRRGYTSNLQAALTNANVRAGISRASAEDFVRGRIPRQQRPIDVSALREGHLVQGRIPVAPTRETLRPIDRPASLVATTGRPAGTQNFFSRRQPPTVARSFNEQVASVQQMMQRHNPMEGAGRGGMAASTRGNALPTTGRSSALTREQGTAENRSRGVSGPDIGTEPTRGVGTAGRMNRPTSRSGSPTGGLNVEVQGGEQTGWRRFAESGSRGFESPGAITRSLPTRQELAQRNARPTGAPAQQVQPAQQPNATWRRFATGQSQPVPDRPTTGPSSGSSRPEAQSVPGRGGWERFRNDPGATQPGTSLAVPPRAAGAGESSGAPSWGWRRFGSPPQTSQRSERPTLDIRKPITTERAAPRRFEGSSQGSPAWGGGERSAPSTRPRSFEGGGRAAPSSPPRTFEGGSFQGGWGGSRRWSAPSSGGYSAPSAPVRTFGGGSRAGGFSGGNRGWSAPRSGGEMRSVPSAPSRSYGGGSRGWSVPSGGGRGAAAPSRGGRSAPAPSRSGGPQGRR